MKFDTIADVAKKAFDSRGGAEGLKRDIEQLREIAMSDGTAKERAKRAADHLKHPHDRAAENGQRATSGQKG